jgi:hypothetical protein
MRNYYTNSGKSPELRCTHQQTTHSCHATEEHMASVICAVTARPRSPPALVLPAAARKVLFRCRVASPMDAPSESSSSAEKKTTTVFVAGSTGRTGKRVVEKLLARGFGVVAGTTDVERARGSLPQDTNLQPVSSELPILRFPCSIGPWRWRWCEIGFLV